MHRRLVAALGSVVLAVAGCGGDADPGSPSSGGEAPTKAQYIGAADKICQDVDRRTQTYSDQVDALPDGSGPDKIAPILEASLAETRKGIGRLRALKVPSEDKPTIDSYLASIDKTMSAYEDLQAAVRDKDETKAKQIATDADPLFDEQRRLAKAYGFKRCRSV